MKDKSLAKNFAPTFVKLVLACLCLAIAINMTVLYLCALKSYKSTANDYTKLLAANVQAKLTTDGQSDLDSVMSSLNYVDTIFATGLYNNTGNLLASWTRNPENQELLGLTMRQNSSKRSGVYYIVNRSIATAHNGTYHLRLGVNVMECYSNMFANLSLGYIILLVLMFVIITCTAKILEKLIVRPIANIASTSTAILKENDLSIPIANDSNSLEIIKLSSGFTHLIERLKQLVNAVQLYSANMNSICGEVSQVASLLSINATNIDKQTSASLEKINSLMSFFNQVTQQVNKLSKQSDNGAATVYQMAQTNQAMVTNITTMNKSVQQATARIGQMTVSIHTNAQHVDEVHSSLDEVSAAMQQILASISNEEEGAKEGLKLSENLTDEAQNGFSCLEETIDTLTKIQSSSQNLSEKLDQLRHFAVNIGTTIHDIEDITKQTNLLSVNAAILSAQAGEHGRGFSVVSNEIDSLATRIHEATRKITSLINTIQEESRMALRATRSSFKIINQGVQLGQQAINAYTVLMESTDTSASKAQQISKGTTMQADEVQCVTLAIENLAKTVEELNNSSKAEAEEATILNSATEKLKENNAQVANSSEEQERSANSIMSVMQNFNEMATDAHHGQQEQSSSVDKISAGVAKMNEIAEGQKHETKQLENLVEHINSHLDQLNNYASKFKV